MYRYNPFEFLAVNDPEFSQLCEDFEAFASGVTWADLWERHGLDALVRACGEGVRRECLAEMEAKGEVWQALDERSLVDDNKLFDHRLNLLVFAMRKFDIELGTTSDDNCPHLTWELVTDDAADQVAEVVCGDAGDDIGRPGWWRALRRSCALGSTYSASPCLLVWDLVCNVTAASDVPRFTKTCQESYLNPKNMGQHAAVFVDAIEAAARGAGAARAVLGLQEFPRSGTPRSDVFERAFDAAGFKLVRGKKSCVFAHRGFPEGAAPEIVADGGDDVLAVMKTLTRRDDGTPNYDKKTVDAFEKTTTSRTMAVRLDGVVFHVVHVKEPKTPDAVALLAAFLDAMRAHCATDADEAYAILCDTNIAKVKLDDAFRVNATDRGMQVSQSINTTSKRRSRLHGQCYDTNKCHVTVKAAKDKFLANKRDTLALLPPFPLLDDPDNPCTLPTAAWPSDHGLIVANYAPGGQ